MIRFERVGPRVQVVQQNLRFRAPNDNDALRKGLEESFASSVLAALTIESEEGGAVIVGRHTVAQDAMMILAAHRDARPTMSDQGKSDRPPDVPAPAQVRALTLDRIARLGETATARGAAGADVVAAAHYRQIAPRRDAVSGEPGRVRAEVVGAAAAARSAARRALTLLYTAGARM